MTRYQVGGVPLEKIGQQAPAVLFPVVTALREALDGLKSIPCGCQTIGSSGSPPAQESYTRLTCTRCRIINTYTVTEDDRE